MNGWVEIGWVEIGWRDLLDVGIVSLLLFVGIAWLRRSRARVALLGLAFVGVVFLVARRLELELTAWLLQGFVAVFVIVVVVVFQEDLRRLFEQIGSWGLRREPRALPFDAIDVVGRAVAQLMASRTGALLVFPGREPLDRHVEGGVPLDGRVSEPLLLSIFDASSPGHDGAVLVAGDRVSRFAVHLPLSTDHAQLGAGGTRHGAALGLAERSDALCVVVSEERGTVSIARDGRLRRLAGAQHVALELREFVGGGAHGPRNGRRLAGRYWREALVSLALAAGAWALFVPGASIVEVQRSAEIAIENLPPDYELEEVEPSQVEVTLSGRRRDVLLQGSETLHVRVDALLVQLGRRTFQITPAQVEHPPGLEVVDVSPDQVRLSVRQAEDGRGDGSS